MLCGHMQEAIPVELYEGVSRDVWFEMDVNDTVQAMSDRVVLKARSGLHPLYSMVCVPAHLMIVRVFGLANQAGVLWIVRLIAGLWLATLYLFLRVCGAGPLAAIGFASLGAAASGAMFFLIVPGYYGLGSVSLMAATIVVALKPKGQERIGHLLSVVLTLAFTVTNGVYAVILLWLRYGVMGVLSLGSQGLGLFSAIWIAGHAAVPGTLFIGPTFFERTFLYFPGPGRILAVAEKFFLNSVVMPKVQIVTTFKGDLVMSVQAAHVEAFSHSGLDLAALGGWLLLLGLGMWGWKKVSAGEEVRLGILLFLAYQLCLHVVYGEETVSYSIHWLPFLLAVAAQAVRDRGRWSVVAVLGLAAVIGAANYRSAQEALRNVPEVARRRSQAAAECNPERRTNWMVERTIGSGNQVRA